MRILRIALPINNTFLNHFPFRSSCAVTRAMDVQPHVQIQIDEEGRRVQEAFTRFLSTFKSAEGQQSYVEAVAELQNPERNTLTVHFPHIRAYSSVLATTLELQFYRLNPFLCEAVRQMVVESCAEEDESNRAKMRRKEFYVAVTDLKVKHQVRHLTADKVGKLIRISGQVVRTHPVHPELTLGTFECVDCGVQAKNIPQHFKYTQPLKCENAQCQNRTKFLLNQYDSLFVDFQRLRIQESQEELPLGCIPRNVEIIIRGEAVETAQPGDHCDFIGTLIVVPDVAMMSMPGVRAQTKSRTRGKGGDADGEGLRGLKALGVRDLTYKLAFLASSIASSSPVFGGIHFTHEEVSPGELWKGLLPDDQNKLRVMSEDRKIVEHLCDGLFPNIYRNDQVKLGILLMLFGGVQKHIEGATLRGDINILLLGDPSCGKSQFLKTVEKFSPRVIYTSGKASSAAGLTAAVVKDEESFDFVIEAGALMLADNGVCCIDEFDKMELKDQVAIHEAMEQQTISITKAGVKATLNARCSILAAANPIGGRYQASKELRFNVELSGPILSRFDLIFIMLDTNNEIADYAIAKRILDTHRLNYNPEKVEQVYTIEDIRKYVMFARCFRPQLSDEAAEELKKAYLHLRLDEGGMHSKSSRTTVRQLESLIRLSEAYARLKCEAVVTVEHVKAAYNLLEKSMVRMDNADVLLDEEDDFYNDEGILADITNQQPGPGADDHDTRMDGDGHEGGKEGAAGEGEADQPKQPAIDPAKLKITFDQYKRLRNLLVLHLREEEERSSEMSDWEGAKQSQLVEWYLELIEPDIATEEQYHEQKEIIERVIRRLVRDDQVLLKIGEDRETNEAILLVNPNYVDE